MSIITSYISIRTTLKRYCFRSYEIILKLIDELSSSHSQRLDWSEKDCYSMLEAVGYSFHPLWGVMPDLSKSSIDLSLIIPVYNSEKYLEGCLLSLLQQKSIFRYELICVNDGSTDDSPRILERFAMQYPDIIRTVTQENQGISCSRNKGITLARGQYIGFVDNDDLVTPDYVEAFVSEMKKTNADMIQSGYDMIDANGNLLKTVSKGNCIWTEESNNVEKERLVRGLPWAGVYKKELFDNVRFPEGFWYEDMVTRMLLMRKAKKIVIINDVLYHYVMHSSNTYKAIFSSGNIKSVDQYWLLSQFLKYQTETMGLSIDDAQYVVILKELSYLLWGRTKNLPQRLRKAVFCLASEIVLTINRHQPLSPDLSKVESSFLNKNFQQWNRVSQILLVKR